MRIGPHSLLTQLFSLWSPIPRERASRGRSWVDCKDQGKHAGSLSPGHRRRSLSSLHHRRGACLHRARPLYVRPGVPARPARDPAERGIVLSRDPGAYATERAAKMADDEAEQERLSGGGCAAELRRLGERLQELERRLCESREPAVEAAAAYCRQLCQVSPSPSAGLSGRSAGGPRLCVRRPGLRRDRCTLPGLRRGHRAGGPAAVPGLGQCARSPSLCCWVRLRP